MRILYITPSPPNDLNRIRTQNLLKALNHFWHEVTLISLYKNDKEYQWLQESRAYVKNVIDVHHPVIFSLLNCVFGIFLPIPLQVAYCFSLKLRSMLRSLDSSGFDLIYIKRLRMAQYVRYFPSDKTYVDITDSITKFFENLSKVEKGLGYLLAKEEHLKHLLYEPSLCRKHKNIVICSDSDKSYLVEKYGCPEAHIKVLGNGIDINIWKDRSIGIGKAWGRNRLVFHWVMNVQTNALSVEFFLRNVFSGLGEKFRFTVIWPKPSAKLLNYQSARISYTWHVKDMQEHLMRHDIFICPIVSWAGVKNKILQAALSNLPIVSSTLGVDWINDEVKKYIYVANTPDEYAKHIETINQMDSWTLKEIVEKQRDAVKKHYDINKIVSAFLGINFQQPCAE